MDWEVRQKREDGAEKVRRPRGHVAHHIRLQQSFHKSLLLQGLHLGAVVTNGCQAEGHQQEGRLRTELPLNETLNPLLVTHTLSLTIKEAGKFIMSETDMKGMN